MSETSSIRRVTHTLENGIHEFVILDFSRAGADAFVDAVVEVLNHSTEAGLPMLVDCSGGGLPLGYMIGRFRAAQRGTPAAAQRIKIALLYRPSVVTGMIGGMLRAFLYTKVAMFKADERDAALEWLKQK